VAELLERPRPGAAADAVVPSAWGSRVHVLPAASRLVAHDGVEPTVAELEGLATVLDGLADRYDAILLDCGPHLGALAMGALTAADCALVVVDPSEFGLRGIAPAVDLVASLAEQTNPRLEMGGIIVNKMTAHHVENERQYARADELAGWVPVWRPAIPERMVVLRAAAERQPIHTYGSKATDVTDAFDHLWLRTRRLLRRNLPVSRLGDVPVLAPSAEAEELQPAVPVER
jgi:chromosome partitioning protein